MSVRSPFSRCWWALAALIVGCPVAASAQAWLPPAGEGSIGVGYQGFHSRDHLDFRGDPFDRGQVTRHLVVTSFDVGLTDRWAIDASLAGALTRHTGLDAGHGPLDNGRYHGAVQDVRVTLGYQVPFDSRWAIAPYVGGILPTHGYETRGHSAFGRGLKTLLAGVWVGRDLAPLLPQAYVQGHYAYSVVAPVEDWRVNRSFVDVEAGYALTPALTVTVAAALQRSHGGLTFPLAPEEAHHVFDFHDRIAREDLLLISAGASVAVGRRTSVYGTVARSVWGRNSHAVTGGTIGLSVSFGGGLSLTRP